MTASDAALRRPPLPKPPTPGDTKAWTQWVETHPASTALKFECLEVEPGHLRIRVPSSWWPLNPNGAFHGGMVLACADQCLGLASMTSVAPGSVPATATLTAEFLRPAYAPLTYDVKVERAGRTLVFISMEIVDRENRLCAKATGTMATNGNTRHERSHREGTPC